MDAGDPNSGQKKATFLERAWQWIHTTFPERQIYIRSDGRVQFFTFGPSLQATLSGLTLIFLGWVAFTTVNVIFKDRIIAANDHRYQQMQAAYENRVADLQISYDELNGALVSAEDRFKATADSLQAKQNAIAGFLNRSNQVQAAVGVRGGMPAPSSSMPSLAPLAARGEVAKNGAPDVEAPADINADDAGSSQLVVIPGPAAPQPRTARPVKSSMLDHAMQRFAALFQSVAASIHVTAHPVRDVPAAYAQHPVLRALAEQTARVSHIGDTETLLMEKTEDAMHQRVGALRNVMRRTGINPDAFARKIAGNEGVGGPEISLDQVKIEGISDPNFIHAYLNASAVLNQLNGLSTAMDHVPVAMPVSTASFDRSSSFGARVDPFTGHYAFHTGIDFAGPWGSVVHATAPGTVVFAGNKGGYGNMVEIDHGYGIHTRYGHLSAINVRVGTRIGKGSGLGRVGSTGRSTGPHVHYEVWYDDVVKNPNNFIKAGRHVL
ncbi:MAG: peptidoglycan DD-metalloendopeptidase family protein [Alphaproteobacteria bacterium]|nr:peptidoglycan DD-metalloendopeptidase family protein [Alphaproteobacteria bacterium]